jgi:nucleoside-diphosphate-sugar epimerase
MGKRILVTGAAGFIGSHLVDTLLESQNWVLGLDSFTDYYEPTVKAENIACATNHVNYLLLREDLTTADLVTILHKHEIDVICHLAGQPGVRSSWGHQFNIYTRNNILATQRLLEAALSAGRIPVVYASSSSVYGNLATMPLAEEMRPAPVSPYGVTKLAAEHLCCLYSAMYGLPTVSLRLFTVFGPRQRPEMAFSRFLNAVKMNEEILIYGDGGQTRDFSYVGDVVKAFQLAADFILTERGQQEEGWVFNVTGENRASLHQVLDTIAEVTSCRPRIRHMPAQPGDVRDTWADSSRIREILNFTPQVDLSEGIRRQWRYIWQKDLHKRENQSSIPLEIAPNGMPVGVS